MKQIYHHYKKWEEYHHGMWRTVSREEEEMYFEKAVAFTGDADLYGEWMLKVIEEWPISCEQNLSNISINRQAWIGHSACCLAIKCPEYITRLAWHQLSVHQQDRANKKADFAILMWENKQNQTQELELFSCQKNI